MVSLGTQPANRKSGFGHSSPTGARAQDLSRQPARPDLWGARVSNDPGLPDRASLSATFPASRFASTRHTGSDDRPQVVVTFSEGGGGIRSEHAVGAGHGRNNQLGAAGATVRLDLDAAGDDQEAYGRILRYVMLASGENFNATLIRDGYATAIRRFPYSRQR